jgi:hypothetical protein
VLRGHVGSGLGHLIDGFEVVCCERGTTRLVGWVADQAALQGAMRAVSDYGFELVSVHEVVDR